MLKRKEKRVKMVASTVSLRETNPLILGEGNGCLRSGRLNLLEVTGEISWLQKRNAALRALPASPGQKQYVLKHILVLSLKVCQNVSKVR